MPNYKDFTDQELDAASIEIERRLDEHKRAAREELLAIQRVRDERAKTARIDRLMAGLSLEERAALQAKLAAAPPAQTMGVGGVESGEHVPSLG